MDRNEAIEIVRMCCPKISNSECDFETAMRVLVPELAESEDERIRKDLIEFVNQYGDKFYGTISKASAISWLEKQGTSYTKSDVDDAFVKGMAFAKNELEKQGGRKPVQETETTPIFKTGDVIRKKGKDFTFNVDRIQGGFYHCDHNSGAFFPIEEQNDWELVEQNPTIEFKSAEESLGISSEEYNKIVNECIYGESKPVDEVEPKFKVGDIVKHKDNPHLTYILKGFTDDGEYEFYAIREDGSKGDLCLANVKYQNEWKLVEQNPTWSDEDEDTLTRIMFSFEEKMFPTKQECEKNIDFLKSLKNRVQPQPKQEWSEEDEYQINTILHGLDLKRELYKKEGNKIEEERYNTQYNWLKSLKPQPHWKPTNEQMEAFGNAIEFLKDNDYSVYELIILFNDLQFMRV